MPQKLYSVLVANAFAEDLSQAHEYHLQQVGPRSAQHLLDEFDTTINRLEFMPEAGIRIGTTKHYWCPIGAYVAVYAINKKQRTVYLERLFYMSANWKEQILNPLNN